MKVKVEISGHYEVQRIPYGKDYKWVPAHALIECDCGQTMDVDINHTTCPRCGVDHTTVVKEITGRHLADEILHPWHPEYEEWLRYKETHTDDENRLEQLRPRE